MDIRSLTQAEAEARAALIDVAALRHRRRPDRPADRPRGALRRRRSTFTCREPGAETFVDCAAEVVARHAQRRGRWRPPSEGRIALHRPRRATTSLRVETRAGRHHRRARACTRPSTRPTARSTSGCRSSPTRPATSGPASTSPTSRRRTRSRSPRRPRGRWSATPATRRSTTVGGGPPLDLPRHAAAVDVQPGRATPARSTRSAARPAATTSASSRASRWRRSSSATPTSSSRLTEQGLAFFGDVVRDAVPAAQVRPGLRARVRRRDGELRLRHVVRRLPAPVDADPGRAASCSRRCLLHEMAHMWFGNIVTMRWWDDLWLNEAFAEFAANWAADAGDARTPTRGPATSPATSSQAYLADQGPTSHPIRQPIRDVAEAASIFDAITYPKGASVLQQLMTYVGEERVHGRDDGVLRPARLGQHHPAGPDRRAGRAPAAATSTPGARAGWRRPAPTGSRWTATATASCSSPAGPTAAPRPQVLGGRRLPRARPTGCERTALAQRRGARARGRRSTCRAAPTSTWSTTTTSPSPPPGPTPARRDALFADAARAADRRSRAASRVATVWDMLVTGEADRGRGGRAASPACCAVETSDSVDRALPHAGRRRRRAVVARRRARPTLDGRGRRRPAATLADDPDRRQVALRGAGPDRRRPRRRSPGCRRRPATTSTCSGGCWCARPSWAARPPARSTALLERDPDPDAWVRALARARRHARRRPRRRRSGRRWPSTARCRSARSAQVGDARSGGRARTSCWRRTPSATSSCCPACTAAG